jgi:hypothetical protein
MSPYAGSEAFVGNIFSETHVQQWSELISLGNIIFETPRTAMVHATKGKEKLGIQFCKFI